MNPSIPPKNIPTACCNFDCRKCPSFKKGDCGGCISNVNASWCLVRTCCLERGYATCGECTSTTLDQCEKFNSPSE